MDNNKERKIEHVNSPTPKRGITDFSRHVAKLADKSRSTISTESYHEPLRLRGGSSSGLPFWRRTADRGGQQSGGLTPRELAAAQQKGQRILATAQQRPYTDTTGAFLQRYQSEITRKRASDLTNMSNEYSAVGSWDNFFLVKTDVKERLGETPCYRNYFNVRDGVILAYANYKNTDQQRGSVSSSRALPNSEILWQQYKLVAQHNGIPTSDLKLTKIVGYNVSNEETQRIAKAFLMPRESKRFEKGSEGYYAFLGTAAANGKVYLLEQHKDVLGNKEISAIEVRRSSFDRLEYIVYHIGNKNASAW